jgi:hypothetical protein
MRNAADFEKPNDRRQQFNTYWWQIVTKTELHLAPERIKRGDYWPRKRDKTEALGTPQLTKTKPERKI